MQFAAGGQHDGGGIRISTQSFKAFLSRSGGVRSEILEENLLEFLATQDVIALGVGNEGITDALADAASAVRKKHPGLQHIARRVVDICSECPSLKAKIVKRKHKSSSG